MNQIKFSIFALLLAVFAIAAKVGADEYAEFNVAEEVSSPSVDGASTVPDDTSGQEELGDVEVRREWLRSQLSSRLTSRYLLAAMNSRVDRMSPEQLDRAIAVQQRKQRQYQAVQSNRQNAVAAMKQRRAVSRDLAMRRRAGFAPVVTWLPSGTQFFAGGGPVGIHYSRPDWQPWSYGPAAPYPYYVAPHRHSSDCGCRKCQFREPPKPVVWHDGLRTRYGVPTPWR